jgi:hypothetical protein
MFVLQVVCSVLTRLFSRVLLLYSEPLFSCWARSDNLYLCLSTCSPVVPNTCTTSLVLASNPNFIPDLGMKFVKLTVLSLTHFV